MRTEVPYDSFWGELRKAVRRGGPFEINSRVSNWRTSSIAATTQAFSMPVTYTSSSAHTTFRNEFGPAISSQPATAGLMWTGETIEKKQMRKLVPDDSPFATCPACGNNVAPDLVYCSTCGKVMPE